jgi:enoyl-[acyl-carrier-protein] reductase (NADH)
MSCRSRRRSKVHVSPTTWFLVVIRTQAEAAGVPAEEMRRQVMELTPLRRFVEADEVADACIYLASERAAAITGEELNVSAGLVMH